MRGIECALHVLERVRAGGLASEALRESGKKMSPGDLTLASSLVYIALRREAMWRAVYEGFMDGGKGRPRRPIPKSGRPEGRRPGASTVPRMVQDCLLLGTAGILELRHFAQGVLVNALLEHMKSAGQDRYVPLVNAVLHSVGEAGAERVDRMRRSPSLEERAIWAGIPEWSLPAWTRTWPRAELQQLLDLMPQAPASTLRVTPGRRAGLMALLEEAGLEAEPSDLSDALHLRSTVLPTSVPGFDQGWCTVQSEGSILAASLAQKFYHGGLILDMCSGRGVKAGQMLQALPGARLEGWELSPGRHRNALREMKRLGLEGRAVFRCGSALDIDPAEAPSLVLLDAPCSGSGTWSRKPESKWRMDWARLDRVVKTQRDLLERAFALCAPGGIIIYVTCSLLRQENENVVAGSLAGHRECAELPAPWTGGPFRRGRPWGTYIWPATPWLDGFYCSIIIKKS